MAESGLGEKALNAVRYIEEGRSVIASLASLMPVVPKCEQGAIAYDLLELAKRTEDVESRAQAIAVAAGNLSEDERRVALAEALEAAFAIQDEDARFRTLEALVPALLGLPSEILYSMWSANLRGTGPRPQTLMDLAALLPVVVQLGGAEAITELARAVHDVARWWP